MISSNNPRFDHPCPFHKVVKYARQETESGFGNSYRGVDFLGENISASGIVMGVVSLFLFEFDSKLIITWIADSWGRLYGGFTVCCVNVASCLVMTLHGC